MEKESELDSYKTYILGRLKEGTINCVVLLEEIQAMGYEDQLTILRDFALFVNNQRSRQFYGLKRYLENKLKWDWHGLAYVGKYLVNDTLQEVCGCRIQNSTSS